ncbi:MAG: phosphate ABC transporter permease subunit PstC [Halapricum sp.]
MSVNTHISTRIDTIRTFADEVRRSIFALVRDLATDELVAGAVGFLAVVAFGFTFVFAAELAVFPAIVFAAVAIYGWIRNQAVTAHALTFLATVSTVLILGLITVYLLLKAIPTFRLMGTQILWKSPPFWDSGSDVYSLAPMMWGTLVTTVIATLVAGPLGIAGAIFVAEIAPDRVRDVIKPAIEMLAGIPSIVYGYLGFNLVNPAMMDYLDVSSLGSLFAVGIVIGVMALPTVVSVAEDAITSVPEDMQDGALALGTTDWQTIKSVVVPASFSGITAAVLLGVGRAIGETMAATVMLGQNHVLPEPFYNVFGNTETLTTLIASQYGNAIGDNSLMSALFAAGVVLFLTVMALSIASRVVEARMRAKLGGSL